MIHTATMKMGFFWKLFFGFGVGWGFFFVKKIILLIVRQMKQQQQNTNKQTKPQSVATDCFSVP